MKNKKWLTYTLGILLTLVVLSAVGFTGFRIGLHQGATAAPLADGTFVHPPFDRGNDKDAHSMSMNGPNAHMRGFDNRGRGGMPFFSPIFGLVKIAILGLVLFGAYKLVQSSGWRLTRVQAASSAPAASEAPAAEGVKEPKESE